MLKYCYSFYCYLLWKASTETIWIDWINVKVTNTPFTFFLPPKKRKSHSQFKMLLFCFSYNTGNKLMLFWTMSNTPLPQGLCVSICKHSPCIFKCAVVPVQPSFSLVEKDLSCIPLTRFPVALLIVPSPSRKPFTQGHISLQWKEKQNDWQKPILEYNITPPVNSPF